MKIEIVERNYDVGIRLKTLIEKKVEKLNRYFTTAANAKVVCMAEGKKYKLEVTISNMGNVYKSEAYGDNMFENIDIVLPKIEKQVIKYFSKNKEKFKKGALDEDVYEFIYEAPEQVHKDVLKTKTFELDPMMLEDAKEALENVGHDFYVFLNAETGKVNVLYHRKNNTLGVIECNY